jgi:CubicO group peptidase (beta-lactamase class C family)
MRGKIALLLLLLLLAPPLHADERTKKVDQLFAGWNRRDSPGCALTVVQDGKVIYKRGYGAANLDFGARIVPSTVFHVASISKQFTAFAILLLAQEGKLSLNDDIRKHLPDLPDFGKTITIQHLIHHTSGLRDQWDLLALAGWRLEDVITEQDILSLVKRQKDLNFAPGDQHSYNNTGYTLLGLIVKSVSGKSLRDFCEERIFRPLGMKHTHFHTDYREIVRNRALSYDPKPGSGFQYTALSYSNVGATSLFTTAEDLAKWDANFYTARVGGQEVIRQMLVKGKLNSGREIDYAAAVVHGAYRGLTTVEHGGSDAGYRADLLRFPQQKFSVILCANIGSFDAGGMARKVADIYLGEKMQPAPQAASTNTATAIGKTSKTVKLPTETLDAYAGQYPVLPGLVLNFMREGERFLVQLPGGNKREITALSETEFRLTEPAVRFVFTRGQPEPEMEMTLLDEGQRFATKRVKPIILTPEQTAEYAGDYYSPELGVLYTITAREGKLILRHLRAEVTLSPVIADEFNGAFPLRSVRFTRNSEKRITGFLVTTGRVVNLRFSRARIETEQ